MEPTTVLATVNGLIELGDKLMDKFPNYKQAVEKDWNKLKLKYEAYKKLPLERRISSFMFNLKVEVDNHLIRAKDYM